MVVSHFIISVKLLGRLNDVRMLKNSCLIPQSHDNIAHGADLAILFLTQFRAVSAENPRHLAPHVPPPPPVRPRCAPSAGKSRKLWTCPNLGATSAVPRPVRRSALSVCTVRDPVPRLQHLPHRDFAAVVMPSAPSVPSAPTFPARICISNWSNLKNSVISPLLRHRCALFATPFRGFRTGTSPRPRTRSTHCAPSAELFNDFVTFFKSAESAPSAIRPCDWGIKHNNP